MFEEVDLQVAQATSDAHYSFTYYHCSANLCSNSSCAGTGPKFCC